MEDESNANSGETFEMDVPIYVELRQSQFASNDLGVYSRTQLSADQFIGSYKGKVRKSMSQCADPNFVWTILSSRQMPLFYIDATDPKDSNWLRFIRSTSDPNKYNVICMQQNQKINYFTFREIKSGEELVTYLPGKKKKPKNKSFQNLTFKLATGSEGLERKSVDEKEPRQKPVQTKAENEAKQLNLLRELDKIDITQIHESNKTHKNSHALFSVDFNLEINNRKKLKRRLLKCDLCTYSNITDINSRDDNDDDDDKPMRYHIFKEHLCSKCTSFKESMEVDDDEDESKVIHNLLDEIIRQVESGSGESSGDGDHVLPQRRATRVSTISQITNRYSFRCNQCPGMVTFERKCQLNKHMKSAHAECLNRLKCVYCSKMFDVKSIGDYLTHLKTYHKQFIINDLLLNKKSFNRSNIDNSIDWFEYFETDTNQDNIEIHSDSDISDKAKSKSIAVKSSSSSKKQLVVEDAADIDEEMPMKVKVEPPTVDLTDDGETQDSQASSTSSSSTVASTTSSLGPNNSGGDATQERESNKSSSKEKQAKGSNSNNVTDNKSLITGPINRLGAGLMSTNTTQSSSSNTTTTTTTIANTNTNGQSKTWTCQMCKKQFDQRVDLSKHACIEMSLRVLKKKKDVRKKKSREAHWKRKIDLSYIESTSLTHIAQNISDNLSFCIDGTNEDLKSYAREVKDYLSTELGSETSLQAFIKLCFPDFYDQFAVNANYNHHHHHHHHHQRNNTAATASSSMLSLDMNVMAKANSYFSDCNTQIASGGNNDSRNSSLNNRQIIYSCKTCRQKFAHAKTQLHEIIRHQREAHDYHLTTTYESNNNNSNNNSSISSRDACTGTDIDTIEASTQHERQSEYNPISAVGCFGSDPYAYLINLHWDQSSSSSSSSSMRKTCPNCGLSMTRVKYRRHCMTCKPSSKFDNGEPKESGEHADDYGGDKSDEVIIIFSARTDTEDTKENNPNDRTRANSENVHNQNTHQHENMETNSCSDDDEEVIKNIMSAIIDRIEYSEWAEKKIDVKEQEKEEMCTMSEASTRNSVRRKRSAQELCTLWDIDTSNIITKKRVVAVKTTSCVSTPPGSAHSSPTKRSTPPTIVSISNKQAQQHPHLSLPSTHVDIKMEEVEMSSSSGCSSSSGAETALTVKPQPTRVSARLRRVAPSISESSIESESKAVTSEKYAQIKTESADAAFHKYATDSVKIEAEEREDVSNENNVTESNVKKTTPSARQQLEEQSKMIGTKMVNNRKVHICEKCGLEFTSTNSVVRHQEKSCLRVRVISLDSNSNKATVQDNEGIGGNSDDNGDFGGECVNDDSNSSSNAMRMATNGKKKCPICASVFFNTHRLSIHIYKHHRNLLGSALQPPSREAKRLNEKALAKIKRDAAAAANSRLERREDEDNHTHDDDDETDAVTTTATVTAAAAVTSLGTDENDVDTTSVAMVTDEDEKDKDTTGNESENESVMNSQTGRRRSSRSMSHRAPCPDENYANLSYIGNEPVKANSKLNSTF